MFAVPLILIFLLQTENALIKDSVLSNCWIVKLLVSSKEKELPFKTIYVTVSIGSLNKFPKIVYFPIFSELSFKLTF